MAELVFLTSRVSSSLIEEVDAVDPLFFPFLENSNIEGIGNKAYKLQYTHSLLHVFFRYCTNCVLFLGVVISLFGVGASVSSAFFALVDLLVPFPLPEIIVMLFKLIPLSLLLQLLLLLEPAAFFFGV